MNGVFPVHQNAFKVNTAGRTGVVTDFSIIKDLETFSLAVESKKEEWTPMDLAGWTRQAITGKKLVIGFKGKRNYGDPGNDFIAGKLLQTGQGCETQLSWTLPNGSNLTLNCVIDLKTPAGGDATTIDDLDFELLSDGLPVYTPPVALAALTFTCVAGTVVGNTKIATVTPTLTAGNSYAYKIGATLAQILVGNIINVGGGWTPYTLATNIACLVGQSVVVVEVDPSGCAVKGGSSAAVVL